MKSSVNYTPSKISFSDCSDEIILLVCNKIHVKMSLKPHYEFPPFCGNSVISHYYFYYYYYYPGANPG